LVVGWLLAAGMGQAARIDDMGKIEMEE